MPRLTWEHHLTINNQMVHSSILIGPKKYEQSCVQVYNRKKREGRLGINPHSKKKINEKDQKTKLEIGQKVWSVRRQECNLFMSLVWYSVFFIRPWLSYDQFSRHFLLRGDEVMHVLLEENDAPNGLAAKNDE